MHRESFQMNSVFCAQPRKFFPLKVLPYMVFSTKFFEVFFTWSIAFNSLGLGNISIYRQYREIEVMQ